MALMRAASVSDFREMARRRLPNIFFEYIDGGSYAEVTLRRNVEDMEALRVHLGLGPIVSIGTSYGGMVAMAHAARYPASVSHLVLIVTAAHAGVDAGMPGGDGQRQGRHRGGAARRHRQPQMEPAAELEFRPGQQQASQRQPLQGQDDHPICLAKEDR
eukprot:gene42665-57756_t